MEVKPGYRRTEVGVIPKDWSVSPLEDFTSFISYGFTNPMPTSDSGVYMITARDINQGRIQFDTARCTTEAAYRSLTAKSRPKKGDLLLTKDGTLGRLALVDQRTVCINQSVAILRPNDKAVPQFLKLLLEAPTYQVRMLEDAGGSTIKHIYITIVNKMPVAVPPAKAEQEAIAEALSDADAFIESLEQLLAKKRQLKQGAMQELLTGKKRLLSFSNKIGVRQCELGSLPDDWQCLQLPSLMASGPSSIKIGPFGSDLKKEYLTKQGFKVYGQENVYEKDMDIGDRFISSEHFRRLRSCEVKIGDFLISMMGTVGKCLVVPTGIKEGIMDSHLLRLRLDPEKLSSGFLAQLFETPIVFNQVKQLSVGGIMEGLSSKIIKSLTLPVPRIKEQIAIAEVLSGMDAEIAALEAKLAKSRQFKQGMMQDLLTGRIRLVHLSQSGESPAC